MIKKKLNISSLLITTLLLLPIFSFSQIYTESELVENRVKEVNIVAREYVSGKIIKEIKNKDILNEYGNSTDFITYKSNGKVDKNVKSYYVDNGKTQIDTTFTENGNIKYIKVFKKDLKQHKISHYQIIPPKDTVVNQTWYRNKKGQDSVLINTIKSKTFLRKKWEYNEDNILKQTTSYSSDGNVLSIDLIKYKNEDNCIIYFDEKEKKREKKCSNKGEEITYFYFDRIGYLYGIKLFAKNKGKKVVTRDEKGLIKNIKYFDKKKNILSEIVYEYVF